MTTNNPTIGFSFYELSLLSFLRESHPDKANDISFIKARAELASEAYSDAFEQGYPIPSCAEIAHKTLFAGLHFSKYDTVANILRSEFPKKVPDSKVKEFAFEMVQFCVPAFRKYKLGDEYGASPEYDDLCEELKIAIGIYLKYNGL